MSGCKKVYVASHIHWNIKPTKNEKKNDVLKSMKTFQKFYAAVIGFV